MLNNRIMPADYPDFEEFGPAPCSKLDPDAFFPIESLEIDPKAKPIYSNEKEVKLVCSACPYQLRCLEYALRNPIEQGIWGGTTEYERKKIRKGTLRSLRILPSKHN